MVRMKFVEVMSLAVYDDCLVRGTLESLSAPPTRQPVTYVACEVNVGIQEPWPPCRAWCTPTARKRVSAAVPIVTFSGFRCRRERVAEERDAGRHTVRNAGLFLAPLTSKSPSFAAGQPRTG